MKTAIHQDLLLSDRRQRILILSICLLVGCSLIVVIRLWPDRPNVSPAGSDNPPDRIDPEVAQSIYAQEYWNVGRVVTIRPDEICVEAYSLPRMCDMPDRFAGVPILRVGECIEFVAAHPYGVTRVRQSDACAARAPAKS